MEALLETLANPVGSAISANVHSDSLGVGGGSCDEALRLPTDILRHLAGWENVLHNRLKMFPQRQNLFDWITQCWNIALGKRVAREGDAWLLGPIGAVNEGVSQFIQRIADQEGLAIQRNVPGSGLVESMDDWAVSVSPGIKDFYRRTSDFKLSVTMVWKPGFGTLGYLVAKLFSRRIQQLNLPQGSSDEIIFNSDFFRLSDGDGRVRYTIWHRSIRATGEVVFFGIYSTCRIPSGEVCVKVVFPLPCGSATVIFRPQCDQQGGLLLVSSGKRDGDPGFYFLVQDRRGCVWKNYLPSLRESILVSEGRDGSLSAEHTLRLWSLSVYSMKYSIEDMKSGIAR